MVTVGALIDAIHTQFDAANLAYGHGTDNAWDEAVALVLAVSGHADDESSLQLELPEEIATEIKNVALQRIDKRQPLAHLLGRAQYMGYEFEVAPGVVVPRSPIGFLLPDGIAAWCPDNLDVIVDLCCGSGCLGIVAALIYPQAQVHLYDIDTRACTIAQRNVERYNLTNRVTVSEADITTVELPIADLVLCNPPYVNALDMRALPAEYHSEPDHGLAAGEDGLLILRPLLGRISQYLHADGVLLGEVGASAPALIAEFSSLPFIWLDLPQGGEGVFLLEAKALNSHTARQ